MGMRTLGKASHDLALKCSRGLQVTMVLCIITLVTACAVSRANGQQTVVNSDHSFTLTGDINHYLWTFSDSCKQAKLLDIFHVSERSVILRQTHCAHNEAPFMYLLMGDDRALLIDTGAVTQQNKIDLHAVVKTLLAQHYSKSSQPPLRIIHTHSHSDHTAGDQQFLNQPGIDVIAPSKAAVRALFPIADWPQGEQIIELGARQVSVFPGPGHHPEALFFHDSETGWLITGDTFFPGRISVENWAAFLDTIKRMAAVSRSRSVTALLGGHIETRVTAADGKSQEAALALPPALLYQVEERLVNNAAKAGKYTFGSLYIEPEGFLQKWLGRTYRWLNP